MKKLSILAITMVFLLALGGQATAGPFHLNWGSEVNPAQCPSGGKLVINVTFKVTNDVDTKVGGGVWAFDDYNKHIQVWQLSDMSFCADVRYVGKFTTIECPISITPQATNTATECGPQGIDPGLAGGIKGNFEGGYMATFTGTLSPVLSTMGNIGTFDYGCLADDPGDRSTCPKLFNWTEEYFTSLSGFDQPWWGWIYHTPKNGTWVNVITGNLGNITD